MSARFAIKNSIRSKLIASFIFVVILTGAFSTVVGIMIINDTVVGQAYDSVQSNLSTAQFIYDERINVIRIAVEHAASLPDIKNFLLKKNMIGLTARLQNFRRDAGIDIMNITDPAGKIMIRSRNPVQSGDTAKDDLFVNYVIEQKKAVFGSDVMSRTALLREGDDLADQAFIKRIPTPHAQQRDATHDDRALVLKAAYPVMDTGRLIGVLYGAVLINKNYEIVDRIKRLVFKDETYDGYDYGTATIFLDDMRIATNVKSREGARAIGTCVSEEVYTKVVKQGKIWLDKAFVVNNWYISSYKPIYNIANEIIGILYVGILKTKFDSIKQKTILYFLAVIGVTLVIAIVIAVLLIQSIFKPVRKLVDASGEIAQGNYHKRISVDSGDELGYLCDTFNKMVDGIVERDEKLKEQTQKQTQQAEKLASLGRLASGIAHEINNPLTGILAFSSELRDDFKDSEYKEDLDLIVEETLRCRKIVKEVLDFARETALEKQHANINEVIVSTLAILEHHVAFHNTEIEQQLAGDIPEVYIDVNQIKSVINNLAVNAVDAMPAGGKIIISTRFDTVKGDVVIQFIDTGEGIPPEHLEKIFDPFFTTKETGKGTGLGLSVTYGIVQRHSGTITVESRQGTGTTFTITLPAR